MAALPLEGLKLRTRW